MKLIHKQIEFRMSLTKSIRVSVTFSADSFSHQGFDLNCVPLKVCDTFSFLFDLYAIVRSFISTIYEHFRKYFVNNYIIFLAENKIEKQNIFVNRIFNKLYFYDHFFTVAYDGSFSPNAFLCML